MTKEFSFSLGDKVRDALSEFKGVVLSRTQYMTGCNTYGIFDGKLDKEGKPREWRWFDESQLIKMPGNIKLGEKTTNNGMEKGGPCNPIAPNR
jgi:hypothetical protein